MFDDSSTLATWLHDAGYRTGFIGKYLNGYGSLSPCIPPGYDEWHVQVQVKYYEYDLNDNGVITHFDSQEADYSGDVMTQRAVDFIHGNPPSKPFFLHLSQKAPHGPVAAGALKPPFLFMRLNASAPWSLKKMMLYAWMGLSRSTAETSSRLSSSQGAPIIDPDASQT